MFKSKVNLNKLKNEGFFDFLNRQVKEKYESKNIFKESFKDLEKHYQNRKIALFKEYQKEKNKITYRHNQEYKYKCNNELFKSISLLYKKTKKSYQFK